MFALNPFVIHISRIYFGHGPSLFLVSLGFYFYVLAKKTKKNIYALLGGLVLGFSAYGYGGFLIAAPIFIGVLI